MLDAVKKIAAELSREPAQVALAWVMARTGVGSTIIGANKLSQLEGNIAATELQLSAEQMHLLNTASLASPGFSASLAVHIRRMIFGGHDVVGWNERATVSSFN